MKKILSIDGGGIKGVFPATILAEFEKEVGQPLYKYFDLIAGTSTGGIIAIGLSLGIPAQEILQLYQERGPAIFAQDKGAASNWLAGRVRWAKQLVWSPKYSNQTLGAELKSVLMDKRIGDAKTRLLVPAWNGKTNRVYIYKTAHSERLTTDYKDLAVDAALATSAAPTFFQEYQTQNSVGLVDGGVWANNPASLAVVEGIGLGWERREIKVLSIGCLDNVWVLPSKPSAASMAMKQSGLLMSGQSHGSLGMAHVLTGDVGGANHKAIYRISQPVPDNFYALDDTSKIDELRGRGFDEFRNQKPDLLPVFFKEQAEKFNPIHRNET